MVGFVSHGRREGSSKSFDWHSFILNQSKNFKNFRPYSDQTIQKTIVFGQVGFQSISSSFSAPLRSSSAKTLLALNNNPAGYAGYYLGEGEATCRLVK